MHECKCGEGDLSKFGVDRKRPNGLNPRCRACAASRARDCRTGLITPRAKGTPRVDLTGRVFGKLTVVGFAEMRMRSYWRCRCACGTDVIVQGSKLSAGHTRSCGCFRVGMPQPWKRKEYGRAMRNSVAGQYRGNARRKGLSFDLDDDALDALFAGDCHYCGCPPSLMASKPALYGEFIYNGIDRYDNERGYVPGNVVSCCAECNYRKGVQGGDAFIAWARKVVEHSRAGRST